MKERDEIDQIFHDQLYRREAEMDQHALEKAMEILDIQEKAIANKRKKRIALFAFLALLITAISIVLHNQNTTSETTINSPQVTEKTESTTQIKTPEAASVQQEHATTVEESSRRQNNKITSTFEVETIQSENTVNHKNEEQPTSIDQNKENCLPTEVLTKGESSVVENTSQSTAESVSIKESESTSKPVVSNSVLSDTQNSISQEIEGKDSTVTPTNRNLEVIEPPVANIEFPISTENQDTLAPSEKNNNHSDVIKENTIATDSVNTQNADTTMAQSIQSATEEMKNNKRTKLFFGMSGIQFNSTFMSDEKELEKYISQRNNQENSIWGFGVDAGLAQNFNRSSLEYGIGFYQSGEDIQYHGTNTQVDFDTTNTWDYRTYVLQIVDASQSGGVIQYDTTFVIAYSDSTQLANIDSTSYTLKNEAIEKHNGTSKIYHVTIPFSYKYYFLQKEKMSLGVLAGVEADFRIGGRSQYLTQDQQSIQSFEEFDGYRKLMMNGAVGLEWQYTPAQHKISFAMDAGLKRNLYSWNKNFSHVYTMPFARLSISYFLN
ncbi:MAG: hypothetical protein IPP69_07055 [Flavobacteriales bacterium]|nr:hypothetical protein [Flavobacteriales bacterium]